MLRRVFGKRKRWDEGPRRFGWCAYGRHFTFSLARRRTMTHYQHEESNWVETCQHCFDHIQEGHYEDWRIYLGSRF